MIEIAIIVFSSILMSWLCKWELYHCYIIMFLVFIIGHLQDLKEILREKLRRKP